jgi:Tetratricopeptide repeat
MTQESFLSASGFVRDEQAWSAIADRAGIAQCRKNTGRTGLRHVRNTRSLTPVASAMQLAARRRNKARRGSRGDGSVVPPSGRSRNMHNRSDRVERLMRLEKWDAARQMIQQELARLPNGDWMTHWWLARLSSTYFEQDKYSQSLDAIQQAATIAPNCPLVLWDLAGTLAMLGDTHQAIDIYKKLIARGVRGLNQTQCGEGDQWARALISDCYFWLALCHDDLQESAAAVRHFRRYLVRSADGSGGLYDEAEALAEIERIEGESRVLRSSKVAGTILTESALRIARK